MRTQYNEREHKNEWVLERWYEKTVHVFGWIWAVLFMLGFLYGFFDAL